MVPPFEASFGLVTEMGGITARWVGLNEYVPRLLVEAYETVPYSP